MSVKRARELRSEASAPERRLWGQLRRLRARGFHFRRQHKVRDFYLDFACLNHGLAVEVDGSQHEAPLHAEHDRVRDLMLRREGFEGMRVSARWVMHDVHGVVDAIVGKLEGMPKRHTYPEKRTPKTSTDTFQS